jgi:MFS family permease
MNTTTGSTSIRPVSFAAPLHQTAFAVICTATLVSNVGGWMYSAASGWLMTSLNPDPFIVALVQVADTLPICLLALPAGALADIFDKRKFLIAISRTHALEKSLKNFGPVPTVSSLTLRRYAAGPTAQLVWLGRH